jgi:hypothetical protein
MHAHSASPIVHLLVAGALAGSAAGAQPLPSSVVAYTGQTAPGTGGATYLLLQQPTITADGDVTFRAELTGAGVTGTNHKGYWRLEGGNPVTLWLRAGAPSPLPGASWGVDVGDATTQAVFGEARGGFAWDVLDGGPADRVLWTEQMGGLRAVVRRGDPVPGIPGATFTGLPTADMKFDEAGRLLFIGGFAGPGVTLENDSALFLDDGATLSIVVREGDAVPGLPAGTVFPSIVSTAARLAPGSDVSFHSAPFVASQFLFIDGIWSNRSGSLTPVVLEGGTAPGLGPGETVFPGIPFANRNGQIAFGAFIQGGAGGKGLWISDAGGSPALAYRSPNLDPPFQLDGTHLFLADNGVFYMITSRYVSGGSRQAILAIGGSGWREVAHAGERVANLPAGIVYQFFDQLLINANGQVAFRATIAGPAVTSANNKVLVAHGADGAFHLVARTGDSIEVAPGVLRTLIGLLIPQDVAGGPGVARGFSDTGSLVWVAQTGGISSAILITNAGVPPAVELVGLEAVQVVQDWSNSIPLVEGKRTYVRAHFQSSTFVSIDPVLHARAAGGGPELPLSPIRAATSEQSYAVPNAATKRGNLLDSTEWLLPPEWTLGDVELEVALVTRPLDCLEAAGPTPNDCKVSASFAVMPRPEVRILSVDYKDAGGTERKISAGDRLELARRLVSAFPVSDLVATYSSKKFPGLGEPEDCLVRSWLYLQKILDGCREWETPACRTLYYGAMRGNQESGCAQITGQSGGWSAAGYLPSDPYAKGRHNHTHEFGHLFGRQHTVDPSLAPLPGGSLQGFCTEIADPGSPAFPYIHEIAGHRRPTLGPLASGENDKVYGLDPLLELVAAPDQVFDLMSYCSTAGLDLWPAKATYEFLKSAVETRFGDPLAPPGLSEGGGEILLVTGSIDPAAGTATLLPFLTAPSGATLPVPEPGAYTLRVHRSGGAIEDTSFAPESVAGHGGEPTARPFFHAIPSPATVAGIEVLAGATALVSRTASATAPVVQLLSPNGGEVLVAATVPVSWSASDADLDALTFVVQFSADGGSTWRTLETNWTGTTVEIDRDALAGTTDGRFRVQATDGLRTASDASDGGFEVADNVPLVLVTRPGNGSLFDDGEVLTLEALAYDPEDGALEGAALQWSSSLDGALGMGSPLSLPVEALEEGLHSITLSAMDSEGNVVQAVVQIRVDEAALLFEDDFESGGTTRWQ